MSVNVIHFPPPARPVSLNQATRGQGRRTYAKVRPWKSRTAQEVAEQLAVPLATRKAAPVPVVVSLVIPFPDRRTRDPHNYALVVKAVVDGLVLAGWVPDDNPDWVTTTEPVLVVGQDLDVVLTLTDRA